MTNKEHYFRGLLTQIKRRYIQVRGGVLFSNCIGTAALEDGKGNVLLILDTLFVLELSANLLLTRRLC
jgi:hypothetical protein